MHRHRRLFLIAVVGGSIVAVFAGCAAAPPSPAAPATLSIAADANGRQLQLAPQSTLVLRLGETPSTGYSWALQPLRGVLVAAADTYQSAPQSASSEPMPGSPGTRVLSFRAEHLGEETIMLRLQRPWEHDTPPAATFSVTVTVAMPKP